MKMMESDSKDNVQTAISTLSQLSFTPHKPSFFYSIGLFLVAIMMILLPLIYLGIIAASGYGIYYHAVHSGRVFEELSGKAAMLVYFGPLIIGSIGVLFMIKPLFLRPPKPLKALTINSEEQPDLTAFIYGVADAVGAPRPSSIEIDMNVNAAAAFRRGMLSLLGNDLKLILGVPLICGMTTRALGGVLAHEFGHFSQGAGMRFTYIIRSINGWFSRVVYDRDQLDIWLDDTAKRIDLRIGIVLHLARLFVWLTRRILWILMWAGHAISCFALRQMEYDADSFEVQFAGSEHFGTTCEQLYRLNHGLDGAIGLVQETYQQGQVSNDLATLSVHASNRLAPELLEELDKRIQQRRTSLFDTHPADRDRIEAAQKLNLPGTFCAELPATDLLRNPHDFCRTATLHYYETVAEIEIGPENLLSNEELQGRELQMQDELESRKHFFKEPPDIRRPVIIAPSDLPQTASSGQRFTELKDELEQAARQIDSTLRAIEEQQEKHRKILTAHSLVEAGFDIKPADFDLPSSDKDTLVKDLDSHGQMMKTASTELSEFHDKAKALLVTAVSLQETALEQARNWTEHLSAISPLSHTLEELHELVFRTEILFTQIESSEIEPAHYNAIERNTEKMDKLLSSMQTLLKTQPYPFPHAKGPINLWELIQPEIQDEEMNPFYRTHIHARTAVSQLFRVYERILGQLCILGRQACETS